MRDILNEKIQKEYVNILLEQSYKEFFDSKLKEWGVKSPAELDDKKKKEFFNMIDKEWKGKGEVKEMLSITDRIDTFLAEKWDKKVEIQHTGEHENKTEAQLKKEIAALRGKPGNKEKMGELLFALRSKQGWKKGKGATGLKKAK